MKYKIIYTGLILLALLISSASACTLPTFEMDSESMEVSLWDQIQVGGAVQACTLQDSDTNIECCLDTFGTGNISGVIGDPIGGFRTLNGAFNITMNVSTSHVNGLGRVFFGLVNLSNMDGISVFDGWETNDSTNGSVYVVQAPSGGNSASLFCNAVSLYDSASLAADSYMLLKIDRAQNNNWINMTFNTSGGGAFQGGCGFPIDNQLFIPYAKTQSYGEAGDHECMNLNYFISTSNLSYKTTLKTRDTGGFPVKNCTLGNMQGYVGYEPFWNQTSVITDESGNADKIIYYPNCISREYHGTISYQCEEGYSGVDVINVDSVNDAVTITIPTENDCQWDAKVRYAFNGTFSKHATVILLGENQVPFYGILDETNETYYFYDIPCQYYNLVASEYPKWPERFFFNNKYPDGETIHILLDENVITETTGDINATVNILNYGDYDLSTNIVRLYTCHNTDDPKFTCEKGPLDDQGLIKDCELVTGRSEVTNASGYKKWVKQRVYEGVVCVQSKFVYDQYHITEREGQYVSATGLHLGWVPELEFNLTYKLSDGLPMCINFIRNEPPFTTLIPDVTFALSRGSVVLTSGVTGAGAKGYCWNQTQVSDYERTFVVWAIKDNFMPYTDTTPQLFDWDENPFTLDPLPSNVSVKYNVSGYVLLDDTVKPDIRVKIDCANKLPVISDINGLYNFTQIPIGTSCYIEADDAGYTSSRPPVTVNTHLTDINITLKARDTTLIDVEFYVRTEGVVTDDYIDLVGAHVEVSRIGYNGRPGCDTESNGRCIIPSLRYDELYKIDITAEDYEPKEDTVQLTGLEYTYTLLPVAGLDCFINGIIFIENTSIANVTIEKPLGGAIIELIEDGYKLKQTTSTANGRYDFEVKCKSDYTVKAIYGSQETDKNIRTSGEGSTVEQDFTFVEGRTNVDKDLANFVNFVQSILLPLSYVLFIMFVLLILSMLYNALFGSWGG